MAEEPKAFFETYCLKCHDEDVQKGDFRLDNLKREFGVEATAQTWVGVLFHFNRAEYENTLHDLLDLAVDLKSLLPEDNLVAGYDKVSEGFGTSAVHMVCYQEGAALALAHALPPGVIDVE